MKKKKQTKPGPGAGAQPKKQVLCSGATPLERRMNAVFETGFLFLMGAAPLIFLKIAGEFENNPKMAFLQWGIALLALLAVLKALKKPVIWKRTPLDIPILLFYVACLVSLFQAQNPWLAVPYLLHWGACVLLYFMVRSSIRLSTVQALLFVCTVSAACVSIVGIMQQVQYPPDVSTWIPQLIGPASTFSNRNMAAQYIALTFPLMLGSIIMSRRLWIKITGMVCLTLAGIYLMYTQARSGWLAVMLSIAGFVGFMFFSKEFSGTIRAYVKSKKFAAMCVVFGIVVVLIGGAAVKKDPKLFTTVQERFSSIWTVEKGSTSQLRIYWRKNTLEMVKDHFLPGIGLGNFKIVYPLYHRAVEVDWTFGESRQLNRVHLDHLQMLVELGFVGFCAYVWMFIAFVYMFWKVLKKSRGQEKILSLLLFLIVVSFVLIAGLTFPWERAMPPVYLFLCFGLMGVLYGRNDPERTVKKATHFPAWMRTVLCLLLVGFTVASFVFLRKIVLSDKYFVQGLTLQEQKQLDRSNSALLKAISMFPQWNFNITTLLARNYTLQKKYERALEVYDTALVIHPNNVNAMLNIGYCYLQMKQYDKAEEYFQRFLKIMPASSKGYNNMGIVYYNTGKYDKAIQHYQKAIELEPEYVEPRFNLGNLYRVIGNPDGAIREYELLVEMNPDTINAIEHLVNLYIEKGQYEKAQQRITALGQSEQHAAKAVVLQGLLYQRQGKYEDALQQYFKAADRDPKNAFIFHSIGLMYYHLKDFEKAQRAFEIAINLKNDLADSLHLLGQLMVRKKEDFKACILFEKAVEANPQFRDAWFNLGTLYLRQGQLDKAFEMHEKTLAIDPRFSVAHYNIGTIRRHQGKHKEALYHFEKSMENPSPLMDIKLTKQFIAELKQKVQ